MNTLQIKDFTIKYSEKPTVHCPIQLTTQIYIEDRPLPKYFIGTNRLSAFAFYQAKCPQLTEESFNLPVTFQKILQRLPHTNARSLSFEENTGYCFNEVPIYIQGKDLLLGMIQTEKYPKFQKELNTIPELQPVMDDNDELLAQSKRKQLFLDGTYGSRKNISPHKLSVQSIQDKLTLNKELYYFAQYSYAGMIGFKPEFKIDTYEQFHEAFGQYIYSFTITKNNETTPLLWPDYLYHQPENHLEFGLLQDSAIDRYTLFQDFKEAETVTIQILAEGFEDVTFHSILKKPQSVLPTMSQRVYTSNEPISFTLDSALLDEIRLQTASVTILTPNKETENGYKKIHEISETQVILAKDQFTENGVHQLSIISENFGELLLLFKYQTEENTK